jgi:hypothetical protein
MCCFMCILGLILGQDAERVSSSEKRDFLKLFDALPREKEGIFGDKAIEKAAPYTHVLLALTEKDIEQYGKVHGLKKTSLAPFLSLSVGLMDRKKPREYGVKSFAHIAHPVIKLTWAAGLFEREAASSEIVQFLRAALKSKEQSSCLSQLLGPEFETFKKKVREYRVRVLACSFSAPCAHLCAPHYSG